MADIVASNSQIGAQFVTTDVDYTEISKEDVIADTERGYVPGFGISLSVMKSLIVENAYFAFQFSQLHGETNYIGRAISFCRPFWDRPQMSTTASGKKTALNPSIFTAASAKVLN
ncbi:hypothetical protein [Methylomonas koyamae]|uniref:hypothetical protein n=1 Tax=Methylomonas koyamae TaxID=702114 RepID=UPI0012F6EFE7|nr:hypothetical protein [Methylomonas koyamae]